MTKLLKPKNMRRLALLSVLAAPIIYLFGGLFTGLIGAHGEIVFADDTRQLEPVSNYLVGNYSYIVTFHDDISQPSTLVRSAEFNQDYLKCYTLNDVRLASWSMDSSGISWQYASTGNRTLVYEWDTEWSDSNQCRVDVLDYASANGSGWLGVLRGWNPYISIELIVGEGVPNPVDNADFVFGQMFPDDNFVSKIGEDVFTGDINSQPICQLIQFADSNMFDIEQYSWGKFLYGYVYYVFTSVLIYEIVSIALSLLLMPLKVVDTLEERIHTS